MTELNKLHTDLHTFSLEIVAESIRNLDLLKNSEPTRLLLNRLTAQMTSDIDFACKAIDIIQNLNIAVDVDGFISEKLQEAQNNTNKLCNEIGYMYKTSQEDEESTRSNVEHDCTEAIAAADKLHSILEILRIVVNKPIQSPEELISKLFIV